MDRLSGLRNLGPVVPIAAVTAGVVLSLARCAVSDLVVRLSAYLYAADASTRARKTEEWLRNIEDMKPSERPSHAGSLLWLGLRSFGLALVSHTNPSAARDRVMLLEFLWWSVHWSAPTRNRRAFWRISLFPSRRPQSEFRLSRRPKRLVTRRVAYRVAQGADREFVLQQIKEFWQFMIDYQDASDRGEIAVGEQRTLHSNPCTCPTKTSGPKVPGRAGGI